MVVEAVSMNRTVLHLREVLSKHTATMGWPSLWISSRIYGAIGWGSAGRG